jgi:hypothetical protein
MGREEFEPVSVVRALVAVSVPLYFDNVNIAV